MSRSLISEEKQCYVCGTTLNLHLHHIYPGAGRREISDKYGCTVYLCARHHNMSNAGVHFDKKLDLHLRRLCQARWEGKYGNRDEFRKAFGCSCL